MSMKRLTTMLCAVLTAISLSAQTLPYQNPNLSAAQRADDLLTRLTLEEKVCLMMDTSPAIERLGIPQFQWLNEALHGIGRNGFATVFPITMGMAASWDDALLHKVFTAVSDEARVKAQQAKRAGDIKRYQSLSFWTPNINIFRDPRWGRGQETYGEDPYLTAKMGLAVVRGLQGMTYDGQWLSSPNTPSNQSTPKFDTPLEVPQVTHWLHNMSHDNVLGMMKYYDMHNRKDERVKVIFLPCYLDGTDGIVNMSYYDVVLGNDLCIYPSYYEPWGYTPLEAIAFKVPCITTDLAGFGLWANTVFGHDGKIEDGVKVIHRTDYNYSEVADIIKDTVADFSGFTKKQVDVCRKNAGDLSKKALWSEFIKFYYQAYDIALTKAEARKAEVSK